MQCSSFCGSPPPCVFAWWKERVIWIWTCLLALRIAFAVSECGPNECSKLSLALWIESLTVSLTFSVVCEDRLDDEEIGRREDADRDREPDDPGGQVAEEVAQECPWRRLQTILRSVAKDTEKLIRQLSLISFLMAQGRPVSALEIKREVEGYSDMNDDAFARRFYADRAELESLGIELGVEKPGEGFFEAELYSLPPENFYLDAIEFSDDELAALSTALSLLTDGGFAYAEPLRLALQQVAWGHPEPAQPRASGRRSRWR